MVAFGFLPRSPADMMLGVDCANDTAAEQLQSWTAAVEAAREAMSKA